MPLLFYPKKPIKTLGMTLFWAVILTGVGVQAEEIASVNGSALPKVSQAIGPGYALQLNSFQVESNAKKFFAGLVKKGYKPFTVIVQKEEETWFKVRMGPYPSKETAKKIATELKEKHGLSSLVFLSGKIQPPSDKIAKITSDQVAPENAGNAIDVVMSQFLVWLNALQGQQLDSYFSFYSQNFESGGKPLKDWLEEQSKALVENQKIKVEVNDLEMLEKGDTVEMSFMENFQSKSFSDIRRKVLIWKKEKGVWKIIVESSEPA